MLGPSPRPGGPPFVDAAPTDEQLVISALESACSRDPRAVAVRATSTTLRYGELLTRATDTAARLVDAPHGPLLFDPVDPLDAGVGILACMLAGRVAVFVPREAPRPWVDRVVHEAGASAWLRASDARGWVATGSDQDDAGSRSISREAPDRDRTVVTDRVTHDGTPTAYLSATSGSTGEPRLIGISYGHLAATALAPLAPQHPVPGDRLALIRSATGMFIHSLLRSLAAGSTALVVEPHSDSPRAVAHLLRDGRVSKLRMPPSVLRRLLPVLAMNDALAGLEVLEASGERLDWSDVVRLREHVPTTTRIMNGFGTSELGIVTTYAVPRDVDGDGDVVPVGYPVEGMTVRVEVDGRHIVPQGSGEIVVTFDDPRRATVPFERQPDGKGLLRTGDAGSIDADGLVRVHGRLDHVAKVGGLRVDLAGIEEVLRRHPQVDEAAAVALTAEGGTRVVAVIAAKTAMVDLEGALRQHLADSLPTAARPAAIRIVHEPLPLLHTGKLDRARIRDILAG